MSASERQIRCSLNTINAAKIIFWDFDGVIKDSVSVKGDAFVALFPNTPLSIQQMIREHHENHGGISRSTKIPLYMQWAGIEVTTERVQEYVNLFSKDVVNRVLRSPWIPGFKTFFQSYVQHKISVIVTATPQAEISDILEKLCINSWFNCIYGYPTSKAEGIRYGLANHQLDSSRGVVIGDSLTDYYAAKECGVNFIYRAPLAPPLLSSLVFPRVINDFNIG